MNRSVRLLRTGLRAGLSRFAANRSGAAASEFALVVPFFIVVVFGTINTGLAMSAVNQIHYAAERSARCLAVNVTAPCSKGNIDSFAKGWYRGPGVTGLTFVATATDPACGKQVTGTADYEILTGMSSTAVSISATACYPII